MTKCLGILVIFSVLLFGCGSSVERKFLEGNWIGSRQEVDLKVSRGGDIRRVENWSEARAPIYIFRNERLLQIGTPPSTQVPSSSANPRSDEGMRYHLDKNNVLVIQGKRSDIRLEILELHESQLKLKRDIEQSEIRGSITITFNRIDNDRLQDIIARRERQSPSPGQTPAPPVTPANPPSPPGPVSPPPPQQATPRCSITVSPQVARVGDTVVIEMTSSGSVAQATLDGTTADIPVTRRSLRSTTRGNFAVNGTVRGSSGESTTCQAQYEVQ